MSKIKILTDTGSGIYHSNVLNDYEHIEVIDLAITLDGKDYPEKTTKPEDFYRAMEASENVPKTSQPTPGVLLEIAERAEKDGYTDIIYITLSSGISGTYSTATTINNLIEGNIKFHAFDTLSTAGVQLLQTTNALRMAKNGKSVEQILAVLEENRKTQMTYFLVDDLKGLIKNGRLKGASAVLGQLLKFRPILSFECEVKGEIHPYAKVRSSKKAAKELVRTFLEQIGNTKPEIIGLMMARKTETYDLILKELAEQKPGYEKLVVIMELSSVITSHVGSIVYGLQYVKRNEG